MTNLVALDGNDPSIRSGTEPRFGGAFGPGADVWHRTGISDDLPMQVRDADAFIFVGSHVGEPVRRIAPDPGLLRKVSEGAGRADDGKDVPSHYEENTLKGASDRGNAVRVRAKCADPDADSFLFRPLE